MMKRISIKAALVALMLAIGMPLLASPATLYDMNYLPYRSYMNPALNPIGDSFVELPGISTIGANVGIGNVSLNDLLYVKDGKLVTFLHPEYGSKDALYAKLKNNNLLDVGANVSLLGFGFRIKDYGYFTFNTSLKIDAGLNMPKDLFKLPLYGTPDTLGVNTFNLQSLKENTMAYVDFSASYSHHINEQWTVGARLHFLMGVAYAQASFSSLSVNASEDKWTVQGQGTASMYVPGMTLQFDEEGHIQGFDFPTDINDYLNSFAPSFGAAIDLGVEYKPIKDLSISLSIRDLGFINWQSSYNLVGDIDYTFDGVNYKPSETINYGDSLLKVLQESYTYTKGEGGSYLTPLNGKLYVGVEYAFLKNMMSVGLLSTTKYHTGNFSEEITVSYNLRPCRFFSLSASYSFFSGGFSTLGLGLNIRLSPFSIYVVSDYTPLYYSKDGIPYRSQAFNVQGGIVLTFGCKPKKSDNYFTPTAF